MESRIFAAPGRFSLCRTCVCKAISLLLSLSSVVLFVSGCQTAGPAPKVNLQEPGWTVRQGQAVWHMPQGGREIAGELLVATRPDGRAFVQFTKAPFPIVTAQLAPGSWWVEFPPQNKRYSGRGQPPDRIIWLHLASILAGKQPSKNFSWHSDAANWRLESLRNGESLEGFFNP